MHCNMESLYISFLIGYTFRDDDVRNSFREEIATRLHAEAENESLYSCASDLIQVRSLLKQIVSYVQSEYKDVISIEDFVDLYFSAKMLDRTEIDVRDKIIKEKFL